MNRFYGKFVSENDPRPKEGNNFKEKPSSRSFDAEILHISFKSLQYIPCYSFIEPWWTKPLQETQG